MNNYASWNFFKWIHLKKYFAIFVKYYLSQNWANQRMISNTVKFHAVVIFDLWTFTKSKTNILEKLGDERAATQTDVTRKCKSQTSFNFSTEMVLYILLPFWSFDFAQLLRSYQYSLTLIQKVFKCRNFKLISS